MVRDEFASIGRDRSAGGEWGGLSQNRERADELIQRIGESSDRTSETLQAARIRLEQARESLAGLERGNHASLTSQHSRDVADLEPRVELENTFDKQEQIIPDYEPER